MTIPNISELPCRPALQTMVSRYTWVKVDFFRKDQVTRDDLYRTIELLCMMYNGWDSDVSPDMEGKG